MIERPLPRYVIDKRLKSGPVAFYFNVPTYYRNSAAKFQTSRWAPTTRLRAVRTATGGRAAALNGLFDEWDAERKGEPVEIIARFSSVDWLFREYKSSDAYL